MERGRQRKRKDEEILKKRAEKVMGFSSASIFPERKLEKGGNYDDRPPGTKLSASVWSGTKWRRDAGEEVLKALKEWKSARLD